MAITDIFDFAPTNTAKAINSSIRENLYKSTCSLEQAQQLRALGVKQESMWYYFPDPNIKPIRSHNIVPYTYEDVSYRVTKNWYNTYSAFTTTELKNLLGNNIFYNIICNYNPKRMANLLIFLLKNKLIKP